MGGKAWNTAEEQYLWSKIAPLAPPGHDNTSQKAKSHAEVVRSWKPLADMMRQEMINRLQPGERLRRDYTAISCYEHYFQNYVKRNFSPNAKSFVDQYIQYLKENKEKNEQGGTKSPAGLMPIGSASIGPSSAGSTSAAPNPAHPKRTVRRKKRQAPLPGSGCQREVTADDIERMNQELWVSINNQRAALGMPVTDTGPQYNFTGHNDPLPPNQTQWPAVPQNGYSGLEHSGQGSLGVHGGVAHTSTPGGQVYAVPASTLAAQHNPGPINSSGLPYLNTNATTWPDQQDSFGSFGQPHPTAAPAWPTQGYFDQNPADPTFSPQTNLDYLNPEMRALYSGLASTNPAPPPLPNHQQQYQVNRFASMPNRGTLGPMLSQEGTKCTDQVLDSMNSQQQQQQQSSQEFAGFAAYAHSNNDGNEAVDSNEYLSFSQTPVFDAVNILPAGGNAQVQAAHANVEIQDPIADTGTVGEHGEGNVQNGGVMDADQQVQIDQDFSALTDAMSGPNSGDEHGKVPAQSVPLVNGQQPQQRQSSEERICEALAAIAGQVAGDEQEKEIAQDYSVNFEFGGEMPLTDEERLFFGLDVQDQDEGFGDDENQDGDQDDEQDDEAESGDQRPSKRQRRHDSHNRIAACLSALGFES